VRRTDELLFSKLVLNLDWSRKAVLWLTAFADFLHQPSR
jgi:hypothetical protein